MRRVSIVIAVCFILAVALGVMGQAPRDLDTIMKEITPIWGGPQAGMQQNLASATPDLAKLATDAAKLQSLFTEAQQQFEKMKMTEAAALAKAEADAAGNAAKEAKSGKLADAKATTTSIGQCKACHAKYRESDGAGGFKLKAQ